MKNKFNKDMTKVPFNRLLLLEWLYDGVKEDYMHCMGFLDYQEDGKHIWRWDSGEKLPETVVGWIDTFELMYS